MRIRVVIFWILNLEERNCLHLQDSNVRAHPLDQTTHQTGVCLILYFVARRLSLHRPCVEASWNVMTRAETRFRLPAKRTSLFKSAGASVQSTTGSRCVRISGSNAGYTMFRGSVTGTGYPLHSPVSPSLPLPCVTMCHHISAGVYKRHVSVSRRTLKSSSRWQHVKTVLYPILEEIWPSFGMKLLADILQYFQTTYLPSRCAE